MKIYVCLAISLLAVSLCTADYVGPAMLALGECDCPGVIFGSSSPGDALTILNSGIHINSPYNPGGNDGALEQSGNANIEFTANYINVVGGIDENFDYPEDSYVHEYPDMEPVPDPYAYLPDAVYSTIPDLGTIADSDDPQTYSPGYYSGGIQISSANIALLPGNYYLDNIGQAASKHEHERRHAHGRGSNPAYYWRRRQGH